MGLVTVIFVLFLSLYVKCLPVLLPIEDTAYIVKVLGFLVNVHVHKIYFWQMTSSYMIDYFAIAL